MDFSCLKLIVWDLDDTFWKGTLSEGGVTVLEDNVALIRELTDRGIVNSICSKNDETEVFSQLEKIGIREMFVFCSINWDPKGKRLKNLICDMGLQPKHTLFIDDNVQNLKEAQHYMPDLMVAQPEVIKDLKEKVSRMPITDAQHKRLSNYMVLEKKQNAKANASDNLEFLYSCNIRVDIHHDCLNVIDRLYELVNRTNQLNFTKRRDTYDNLKALLEDKSVNAGYVSVRDKFGDYGIVGFYAERNRTLIHFLFSCRTIGQGIEQYVYAHLNYPQLKVAGSVVSQVTDGTIPNWINQKDIEIEECQKKSHQKVVIKGGCDFKSMTSYFQTSNLYEEFSYVGKSGNNIENVSHSTNYLNLPFLNEEVKKQLLKDCIFLDEGMFHTAMYDDDVKIVFLSTLIDSNLGVYRNKENGVCIAFGEKTYPLTDPCMWQLYVTGKIFTADNSFTIDYLRRFSEKYEFLGGLTPEQILDNAKKTLSKISPEAKACYLLGSETPYLNNTQRNYHERELFYREVNVLFRKLATEDSRVLIIDFNDFIHGQEDFNDNINHFVRRVYYEAACVANKYIQIATGGRIKQKGKMYLYVMSLVDKIEKTGFFQSDFYLVVRKPYLFVKKLLS